MFSRKPHLTDPRQVGTNEHTSSLRQANTMDKVRLKKSSEMQKSADIYLLQNYSTYFGRPSRPSSGVHKNVVAASGTDHTRTIWGASFLKRDQISLTVPHQSLFGHV